MAYPTSSDLRAWLRIPAAADPPTADDTALDARLTELIAAAAAHVETACGTTFADTTPERIALAVKFLAGFWFENPVADQKATDAAIQAVDILIAGHRVWGFSA